TGKKKKQAISCFNGTNIRSKIIKVWTSVGISLCICRTIGN
ncbi:hypothetical protein PanWU01x14_355880, partial [Parasponia andersonii]